MTDKKNIHNGRTRIALFIVTASVLVILPVIIFAVQQQQDLRQRAASDLRYGGLNPTVAYLSGIPEYPSTPPTQVPTLYAPTMTPAYPSPTDTPYYNKPTNTPYYPKPTNTPYYAPTSAPYNAPTTKPYGGNNPYYPTPSAAPYNAYPTPAADPYAAPTQSYNSPYMTPSFFCLAAPCPITPEAEPTLTGEPPTPVYATPAPEEKAPVVSPEQSDPCDASAYDDHGRKKKGGKHTKHRNAEGNIGELGNSLFEFLLQLINLLLQLLGQQQPQPQPAPLPEPVDPCAPAPVPSGGVEPSQAVPLPSSPIDVEPSGGTGSPAASIAPSTAVVEPSTAVVVPSVSVAPSIAAVSVVPSSGAVVPSEMASTSPAISVTPSTDPCAISNNSLASDNAVPSRHHHTPGLIQQFMRFILSLFDFLFKFITQGLTNPGGQNPTPSVIPTPETPGTNPIDPINTPAPTEAAVVPSTAIPTTADITAAPTSGASVPTTNPVISDAQPSPCPSVTPPMTTTGPAATEAPVTPQPITPAPTLINPTTGAIPTQIPSPSVSI